MKSDAHINADRYMVRFEDGLRHKLKELAARNRRTLNAEINLRLVRSLEAEGESVAPSHKSARE